MASYSPPKSQFSDLSTILRKKEEDLIKIYSKNQLAMKGIEVSSYERAKIRELHRNGTSASDLAQKYELHLATVYRIIREKMEKKKKRGRPPKMTGYQQGLLRLKMRRNANQQTSLLIHSNFLSVHARFAENSRKQDLYISALSLEK